jgi:site-specific DNA recombinase
MSEVAIYIRVSTTDQQKGYGMQVQYNAAKQYCLSQKWKSARVYREVHNGTTLNRPKLRALIKAISKSKVSIIIVYNTDRLSRNKDDLARLLDKIDSYGARIISVKQDFDTGSIASIKKALFSMLGATAEMEWGMIIERTIAGRKQKVAAGGYAAGSPPFGYRIVNGELKIKKNEARVVRKIFRLRRKGWSLQQIVATLNSDGVPTQRGGKWYPGTIKAILENKKYHGILRQSIDGDIHETSAPHLKIVDE